MRIAIACVLAFACVAFAQTRTRNPKVLPRQVSVQLVTGCSVVEAKAIFFDPPAHDVTIKIERSEDGRLSLIMLRRDDIDWEIAPIDFEGDMIDFTKGSIAPFIGAVYTGNLTKVSTENCK